MALAICVIIVACCAIGRESKAINEYELATLALRESALWVAIAQVSATLVVGCAQVAVVWFGIRVIRIAGDRRAAEQDQRHAEAMRESGERHTEAMRALEVLIERTAAPRPPA